jgi:hypothetical protein
MFLRVFVPRKDGESVLDRGGMLHKASTGVIEDEAGNCFTFCILADVLGTEDLSFSCIVKTEGESACNANSNAYETLSFIEYPL